MLSYYSLLPGILAQAAGAFLFFGLLLGSALAAFGKMLGTPARAAAIPLLAIPLAEDWVRYAFHCSFRTAWMAALLLWVAFVIVRFFRSLPPLPRMLFFRRWRMALLFVLLAEVLFRLWIFNGSVPNPRDDIWGGYKSNGLFNSMGWPTSNPELPELGFNYYYFAYIWPAGLAAWTGMSLWVSWWSTIIVLSALGLLLILELWLPFIRGKKAMAVGALAAMAGATAAYPLDLALRRQPKFWIEWGFLPLVPRDLFLQIPVQVQAVEAPFDIFCSGILLAAFWLILRNWRRPMSWAYHLYIILAIGALPGYCTFFLIGYALVALPAIFLLAARDSRIAPRLIPLALCGTGSLAAAWPLFIEQLKRHHAILVAGADPLYLWVPKHLHPFTLAALAMGIVVLAALLNPLGVWASFFHRARSNWAQLLRFIFLWGTVTCLWGGLEYVRKMGAFISLAGLCLFVFQARRNSRFEAWLAGFCLLGTAFLFLNNVRANLMVGRMDPVWHVIDQNARGPSTIVYFAPGDSAAANDDKLPPYFSHARFMGPPQQIDIQFSYFLPDPAALEQLPPDPERLRRLAPGAASYLRLWRTVDLPASPDHQVLYRDPVYSLTREAMPR